MPFDDDAVLKSAYSFWEESCPTDGIPTRVQIDALRIPKPVFPYLILAEVLSDVGQVRYRLLGGEIVQRWGANFVGRTSDELFADDYRDYLHGSFALCIRERRPVFNASRFRWDVGGTFWTRRLILPIADLANGHVFQLLIVQTWPSLPTSAKLVRPIMVSEDVSSTENLESQIIRS